MSHFIGCQKGRNTLLEQKVYATFDAGERSSLGGLCLELFSEQRKTWQDLLEGCESLKGICERDVSCRGFKVRLQHNPRRIKSSMAGLSEMSSNEPTCFLCLDNLPENQKGILYRGEYLILCNPMPIFSPHFTVSHLDHCRQTVGAHLDIHLQLAADLGSAWVVLYNGPSCGASAPNHMHFQITPSGQMPVEKEIREEGRLSLIMQRNGAFLYRAQGLGREAILLKGDKSFAVGDAFNLFVKALRKILSADEEPMMNIASCYEENEWHLVIFLRRKHRPDVFFREGSERIVVSPGVIDMGGVFVIPVERDLDRLDAALVEAIYREVSMERETVEDAIKEI